MALNINIKNEISGYYYYDKNLQKIEIQGTQKGDTLFLKEIGNININGSLEIIMSKSYIKKAFFLNKSNDKNLYCIGKWYNEDKSKSLDIQFTEIKTIDKC